MTVMRGVLAGMSACSAWVMAAGGAPLTGTVRTQPGQGVAGALVTLHAFEQQRDTTVYADAEGHFVFPSVEAGTYHLRARRSGYRDNVVVVDLPTDAESVRIVALERETDPRELAWQLPANRWLALAMARLPDDEAREEFKRQCTFCHQQGNWATRVQRDPEEWRKIFALMARMGGILSSRVRDVLPEALNSAYDEASYIPALGEHFEAPAPPRESAVITEWEVGAAGSFQHDAVVHPDGRVYVVDMTQDRLYRLDPQTGVRSAFDIPRGDSPLGGVFAQQRPIPINADAHVGPHSIQVAPDGALWMSLALGNKLARFDPVRERFEIVEQAGGGLYPHTLRFDAKGRLWYTLAISNHVGMLDPSTGEKRTFRLPARTWGEAAVVRFLPFGMWLQKFIDLTPSGDGPQLPIPYGIDIAPDGGVWFSQLNERRIGRLDPESGAVTLIDTPFPAPRRLRFDGQGNLWIPSFSGSLLARFTPSTGVFKTWPLPTEPAGTETPYALNIDRRRGMVWICGTNSDTLIRFDPADEQFSVYPMPTRVTYTREIDFDAAGAVWTSNSNLPSWQIEGAVPKLIRLEPRDGGTPHLTVR